jgi:hypothetical protein
MVTNGEVRVSGYQIHEGYVICTADSGTRRNYQATSDWLSSGSLPRSEPRNFGMLHVNVHVFYSCDTHVSFHDTRFQVQ